MKIQRCDIAILGGGLAGCLLALAFNRLHPDKSLLLIEQEDQLGGNHIWSFFGSDVSDADRWLIAPLIVQGWRGYDVHFPAHSRALDTSYYSIESDRLDTVVRSRLPADSIIQKVRVLAASATSVVLSNGIRVEAEGVIDARGTRDVAGLDCGWQKFMGQMIETVEPHGLTRPIVMDARVPQLDGYRFVYVLPFSPVQLFIEDTYYSDTPDLDAQQLSARISAYAEEQGWEIERVVREETGVLPVVKGGDFGEFRAGQGDKVALAGTRAGLFQPLTSYSLPDAVRLATLLAGQDDLSGANLRDVAEDFAQSHWKNGRYYRLLTHMLFEAAEPLQRYRVLERFYALDPKLIERFYAGKSTLYDRARILAGKPPVPVRRAMASLWRKDSL